MIIWNGNPGDMWTNTTGKVAYQFHCAWENTCGVCAQYDKAISPSWPIPIHYGCRCWADPIWPGQSAEPWIDFRSKIASLPHHQQVEVIGKSAWDLVRKGVVDWEDVVTRSRVRSLREVVAHKKLDVPTMIKVGISPWIAEDAFKGVNTPLHELKAKRITEAIERLKKAGLTREEILRHFADTIATWVVIDGGPTGPDNFGPPPPPPVPPPRPKPPTLPPETILVIAREGKKRAAMRGMPEVPEAPPEPLPIPKARKPKKKPGRPQGPSGGPEGSPSSGGQASK